MSLPSYLTSRSISPAFVAGWVARDAAGSTVLLAQAIKRPKKIIAVGTAVAGGPPHRSLREECHWGREAFLALLAGFCSVLALFAAGYGYAWITLAGNWRNLCQHPELPQSSAGRSAPPGQIAWRRGSIRSRPSAPAARRKGTIGVRLSGSGTFDAVDRLCRGAVLWSARGAAPALDQPVGSCRPACR